MTKQQTIESSNFHTQFEAVLRQQRAACRAVALAALDRVFPADSCTPADSSRPSKNGKKSASGRRKRAAAKPPLPRRSHSEMAELGERLFKVICARPGQPKTALARELGLSPRELDRPMDHLRRSEKVRTVGQRHLMRYFPAIVDTAQRQQDQADRHAAAVASNNDGQVAPVR
jgi:hypothetical protein